MKHKVLAIFILSLGIILSLRSLLAEYYLEKGLKTSYYQLPQAKQYFEYSQLWAWDKAQIFSKAGEYFIQNNSGSTVGISCEDALDLLVKAASRHTDAVLWFNLGLAFGGLENWSEAAEWLQRAVTVSPKNQTFKQVLSQALYNYSLELAAKDEKYSRSILDKSLEYWSQNQDALIKKAFYEIEGSSTAGIYGSTASIYGNCLKAKQLLSEIKKPPLELLLKLAISLQNAKSTVDSAIMYEDALALLEEASLVDRRLRSIEFKTTDNTQDASEKIIEYHNLWKYNSEDEDYEKFLWSRILIQVDPEKARILLEDILNKYNLLDLKLPAVLPIWTVEALKLLAKTLPEVLPQIKYCEKALQLAPDNLDLVEMLIGFYRENFQFDKARLLQENTPLYNPENNLNFNFTIDHSLAFALVEKPVYENKILKFSLLAKFQLKPKAEAPLIFTLKGDYQQISKKVEIPLSEVNFLGQVFEIPVEWQLPEQFVPGYYNLQIGRVSIENQDLAEIYVPASFLDADYPQEIIEKLFRSSSKPLRKRLILAPDTEAELEFPSGEYYLASGLGLVSTLGFSAELKQNQDIARIIVKTDRNDETFTFTIKAGRDTAEARADQPRVMNIIRHHKAPIARTEIRSIAESEKIQEAKRSTPNSKNLTIACGATAIEHDYWTEWSFPRSNVRIQSIKIQSLMPSGVLHLKALTLLSSKG